MSPSATRSGSEWNTKDQAFTGASTGQTAWHWGDACLPWHSVQAAALITYLSSPAVIAEFGHSGSQAPQLVQSSVIFKAIYLSLT
ncbi:MAG: hypothetical protein A2X94_04425 [Bdellovibrionales bacterium GWB1_55_8]|nr:MAG: hypothetical protein A2X94_04425 [Bdellovibrionales bacterium GWB1_55_8]